VCPIHDAPKNQPGESDIGRIIPRGS
jgi:hypothetical protein